MELKLIHRKLNWLYVLAVIISMASLTLTIFLIGNFAVSEGNPIVAFLFNNLGYYPMYAINLAFWVGMFLWIEHLKGKDDGNVVLWLKGSIVFMALLITSVDLLHNIEVLSLVI